MADAAAPVPPTAESQLPSLYEAAQRQFGRAADVMELEPCFDAVGPR